MDLKFSGTSVNSPSPRPAAESNLYLRGEKCIRLLCLLSMVTLLSGCAVFFGDLKSNQSLPMRSFRMRPAPATPVTADEQMTLEAYMAQAPIERNNVKAYKEEMLDSYQVVVVEHPPGEPGEHSTIMKYLVSSVYIYGESGPFFVWRPNAESGKVALEILTNVINGMDYQIPLVWHGRTFIVKNLNPCQYTVEEKDLEETFFTHRYNICNKN